MASDRSHRKLAEKFALGDLLGKTVVTDSLLALVRFTFTEEEAQVVATLGPAPLPVRAVALKLGRRAATVRPVLESLAERVLILGLEMKGIPVYAFMPLVPGVFETQMIRSRGLPGQRAHFEAFARLYGDVHAEYSEILATQLVNRQVRTSRIIPIQQSINASPGIMPLATDHFEELAERSSSFALVNVCACRWEHELVGEGCGKPLDVCTCLGWIAERLIERGLARRISREEFLEVKARATEAGLVQLTDNIRDPLQVCSCCSCCCTGLKMVKEHNLPSLVARSHFEARIDGPACVGCTKCVAICPMDAIAMQDKRALLDVTRCIGCGLCVGVCGKARAITLVERPGHKEPAAGMTGFLADRYEELKGPQAPLARAALGAGRLLSRISPVALSGPKYHSGK
jgi:electron transport complex protein RnfB